MKHVSPLLLILSLAVAASVGLATEEGTPDPVRNALVGDALLNNHGYELLRTLTTRFGPRLAGTEGNTRSMDFLEQELHRFGIETRRETYTIPGWSRLDDRVTLIQPLEKTLRSAALGYVDQHDPIEAAVAYVASGDLETLDAAVLGGKIALVAPNISYNVEEYQRLAEEFGIRGVLLINRVNGGQLLARVANHDGLTPPVPIYSITVEEGLWMQRQLDDGMDVRVRIETRSGSTPISVDNLVAVFPGASEQKVVIGGHFDSWDLGQGAMDNGLGVAQLFDTARLLQTHGPTNAFTVEIVWFNAEEWGLWGSLDYTNRHDPDSIRVMLNLDMVGEPIAINAMGFDELVPVLEAFSGSLGSWQFEQKVANKTWLGSDHHPFILKGIPAITFNAPIAPEDVRYYHDFGDTFDKVDPEMLGRATALVALLSYDLANDTGAALRRYNESETAELFRKAGLEEKLTKAGKWPFGKDQDW
ncbi:MAG: M28 family peptidase [Opitutaceae bacterium]